MAMMTLRSCGSRARRIQYVSSSGRDSDVDNKPLCHHFMLVLYTKVYTRFMPRVHRLALYQVDLQVVRICNIKRHLQNHHHIHRTITSGTPVPMSSVRPWSRGREVFSGTSFLMNPVLPAYFISAYAVALFRFMLVLCNARDLSWLCLGPA